MDGGKAPPWSPTVFLVTAAESSQLASPFHTQNQFQVVMAGSGKLGAHDVRHGSVHYAGAYTGYGPVVVCLQSLSYFTIRAVCNESGANFIDSAREKMVRGPKRHMQGPPLDALPADDLARLTKPCVTHLIFPQPDHLEACAWYLPPNSRIEAPVPAPSGQFQFAISGNMRHGDVAYRLGEPLCGGRRAGRRARSGATGPAGAAASDPSARIPGGADGRRAQLYARPLGYNLGHERAKAPTSCKAEKSPTLSAEQVCDRI